VVAVDRDPGVVIGHRRHTPVTRPEKSPVTDESNSKV
jgi:hypothetical protein